MPKSSIFKQLFKREIKTTKRIKIKANISPFKQYLSLLHLNKNVIFENVGLEYSIKTIINISGSRLDALKILNDYKTFLFSFIKHIIFNNIDLYYLDLNSDNIKDDINLSFSKFEVDIFKNKTKEHIISDTDIQETYTSQFDTPEFAMPYLNTITNNNGSITINIPSFIKPNSPINKQPELKLYKIANSYLIINDASNFNKKTHAFISNIKNYKISLKYLNLPEYLIKEKINNDYIDKIIIKDNKQYYDLEMERRLTAETEATMGGSNNKYQIFSDKKTNIAYIKYNNKKFYFYENENKIFIKINNKKINITKKILNYNNKLNFYFIKI
jgi:hypothetical protein